MKRFKILTAILLAFVLSFSAGGATAFANGNSVASNGAVVDVAQATGATTSADPSTMDSWIDLMPYDTSEVGRIWVDKTVLTESYGEGSEKAELGNSTFLTALSALSSTSNIASTVTAPLDAVLVLDASGTMGYLMGKGPNQTSCIEALQDAANAFIDAIAEQNRGISDAALQHQVSIVKFAGDKTEKVGNDTYLINGNGATCNYSQVMKAMSPCTDATRGEFKSQINDIRPHGTTCVDNGLALAEEQTSGRNGEDGGMAAKKIVVFFTDGAPSTMSSFDNNVASRAVSSAKAMKDAGASVYTVGIFNDANPSANPEDGDTSNENRFMQAVSSNYPGAMFTQDSGDYTWNFADRTEGSNFYKSAKDAGELANVFKEISKEIVTDAGYPTKTTEGTEFDSGFVTFDDSLGAYMKVDDVCAIRFNGAVFTSKDVSREGNVTTYQFGGAETIDGKHVLLRHIVITVTRSDDAATGDVVQVKVPAGMIPLRNFNVNEDEMFMSVTDAEPLSVFYTSSLKEKAAGLLAKSDAAMASYLRANMTEDGKAAFLANQWSGELGNVTATFEPSSKNSYYYFTRDVPIYANQACTQRAKEVKAGETYWYQHEYYELQDEYSFSGRAELKSKPISFSGGAAEQFGDAIDSDANGVFFKAGTARPTSADGSHIVAKVNNVTSTAADVLNPKWNDAATMVSLHLGNNGKLLVDTPGSLAVTKEIRVPEGYSRADFADTEFSFTLAVPGAASKTLAAEVTDAQGTVVAGAATSLAFDAEGNATFTLKDGQTLHVYGLAGGSTYTVAEDEPSGWQQYEATGQEGRITAGQTSEAKFVNTYSATGHLGDENMFIGAKVLKGREWTENDRFVFRLKAASASSNAPLPQLSVPEGVMAEPGSAYIEATAEPGTPAGDLVFFGFGDIEYTKPGTYIYEISESEQASNSVAGKGILPGVSASQALYQIVVTVDDTEHKGTLSVGTERKKLFDDDGTFVPEEDQHETPGGAVFVNEYNTELVRVKISGGMMLIGRDMLQGDGWHEGFGFTLEAADDAAQSVLPTPKDAWEQELRDGAQGSFSFGGLSFTEPGTYTFKMYQSKYGSQGQLTDLPADGTAGIVFDRHECTVKVVVTDDRSGALKAEVSYEGTGPVEGHPEQFVNTYAVAPMDSSVTGQVTVTKILTGRNLVAGEFSFELLEGDQVVAAGTNDADGNVTLSAVTYKKPGTYQYTLREVGAGQVKDNVTYDDAVFAVETTVTDNGDGTLGVVHRVEGDAAAVKFANVYTEPKVPAQPEQPSAGEPQQPQQPGAGEPQQPEQPTVGTIAQTGDNAMGLVAFFAATALVCAAALVGLIASRSRTRRRN